MQKLFLHPFVVMPMKFIARIAISAIWGVLLSPFDSEVKAGFSLLLAVVACLASYAFVSFDRMPISASRLALYGLLVAGEALFIGAIVLSFLGAYTGVANIPALLMCVFSSAVLSVYSISILYKDNMPKV